MEKEINPLTWEQAKEVVAKRHGLPTWNGLILLQCGGRYLDSYVDEAAELYMTSNRAAAFKSRQDEVIKLHWMIDNGITWNK